jgi:acetoin utilization protein AcuB
MQHGQKKRTVAKMMRTHPVTIPGSATLPDAYWLMMENKIRRLLVVDDGQLVGVVTIQDLRGAVRPEIIAINPLKVSTIFSELPVRQLMTKEPITITPEASVMEAAQTMLDHKISTLPVVDGRAVVGLVTQSDLFRVLVDLCQAQGAPGQARQVRRSPRAGA